MRVLRVEDDTTTAKSITMMLASEGFVCDATDLGEDWLEIGQLYDYDIIILDLILPDIDGYEVLRRLRAARVKTPILILSGLTEPDKKIKGLGIGADDYLTKPFDKGELVARRVAVSDTGSGMSPGVLEKVFEPFFTTKDVGKGSGLGLSMVYGFAQQSGGHVTVYSEVDHGTTVKLYMPRSEEDVAKADNRDDPRGFARGSGRILLIEDDERLREVPVTTD